MAAVVSVVAILPGASVAADIVIPATFFTVVDQEGVNDVNSDQVDMTQMGRDDSDATMYKLFWSWDSTSEWTGTGQTGDACALFDSDGDGNVNFAVCARIENPGADPAVAKLTADSPMLFSCDDSKNDRCSQPTSLPVAGVTAGTIGSDGSDRTANLITDTDPFAPLGSNSPNDVTLQVNIPKLLVPDGLLVNVCSYPSAGNGGNNNPFDCIVTPGAGFLVIVKDAGNDTTTSFPFAVSPVPAGVPSTYTIVGSGSNPPIGVVAGTNVETVTETVPTGWSLSNASCKLADGTTSTGTFDSANHRVTGITIQSGLATTCTFTNVLQPVTLTVIKNVVNDNGGTATASAFTMNVTGGNPTPGSFPGAASPGTDVSIQPNVPYSVTETGPSGYTQTNATAGCASLTGIPPGGNATCTITNDDVAPQLVVVKHVINDNGGTAVAGDFTLDSGGSNDTPDDFAGAEAPGTTVTLDQGAYTVSETAPDGYAASYSDDCSGTIAVGETKTCTVTNDDIAPQLTVIKHVINDNGGTAVAGDFTMTVDDPGTNPASFPGAETPGTEVTVDPGAYTVSETGPAGYADSYSDDCTGTITVGQTKTCTVTNDDRAPALHLRKTVTNDNGGTAAAGDWTLHANGTGENDLVGPTPVDSGPGLQVDTFALSESGGPSGYAAGDWSCVLTGTETPVAVTNSQVALGLGDDVTCTINNNDIAAKLIVIKHVINDNVGTAVAGNFTMTVDDPGTDPASFPGAETPGTEVTVDPGAYAVSETGPPGYAASYSTDCTGTLAIGQVKTCTVTNDDVPPPAIDLSITKTGPTASVLVGSNFTYKLTVRNAGPDTATNVTVEDQLPAGTKYVSVSTTQGTCTGGQVISCSLGAIPRDGQVVITVVVKAMKTGTQVNTATVTGKETDTNPANNRATQETLVRSVLQPPEVCPIMTVRPRSLPVGRKTTVRVAVGLNGRGVKGVRILLKGAGIRKTGVTNRYGRVRITVRPRTAGVIVVRMVNKPTRCATRRIGAVGVFQPPFTG